MCMQWWGSREWGQAKQCCSRRVQTDLHWVRQWSNQRRKQGWNHHYCGGDMRSRYTVSIVTSENEWGVLDDTMCCSCRRTDWTTVPGWNSDFSSNWNARGELFADGLVVKATKESHFLTTLYCKNYSVKIISEWSLQFQGSHSWTGEYNVKIIHTNTVV